VLCRFAFIEALLCVCVCVNNNKKKSSYAYQNIFSVIYCNGYSRVAVVVFISLEV